MALPDRPGPFVITSYSNIRVNGKAVSNREPSDLPILEWQLAWGTHPTAATDSGSLNLDGTGFVTGLVPGGTYYFWNRIRNADGWSKLSAVTQVTMKNVPDAPKAPMLLNRTQTEMSVIIAPNDSNGAPITNYSLVYGLSPTNSDNLVVHGTQSRFLLTNLDPGKTYYFWGKTTNVYGDSDWSARSAINLLAGAWVKQGATWKRAVPYVRVSGVWVLARPWLRGPSGWKEVSD